MMIIQIWNCKSKKHTQVKHIKHGDEQFSKCFNMCSLFTPRWYGYTPKSELTFLCTSALLSASKTWNMWLGIFTWPWLSHLHLSWRANEKALNTIRVLLDQSFIYTHAHKHICQQTQAHTGVHLCTYVYLFREKNLHFRMNERLITQKYLFMKKHWSRNSRDKVRYKKYRWQDYQLKCILRISI